MTETPRPQQVGETCPKCGELTTLYPNFASFVGKNYDGVACKPCGTGWLLGGFPEAVDLPPDKTLKVGGIARPTMEGWNHFLSKVVHPSKVDVERIGFRKVTDYQGPLGYQLEGFFWWWSPEFLEERRTPCTKCKGVDGPLLLLRRKRKAVSKPSTE